MIHTLYERQDLKSESLFISHWQSGLTRADLRLFIAFIYPTWCDYSSIPGRNLHVVDSGTLPRPTSGRMCVCAVTVTKPGIPKIPGHPTVCRGGAVGLYLLNKRKSSQP